MARECDTRPSDLQESSTSYVHRYVGGMLAGFRDVQSFLGLDENVGEITTRDIGGGMPHLHIMSICAHPQLFAVLLFPCENGKKGGWRVG